MPDPSTRALPTEMYAPSPAKPRRTVWMFLGLLAVLACSGGILGYVLAGGGPPKRTVGVARTPEPSASLTPKITLVSPAKLGNRLKNKDPQLNAELAKDMASMRSDGVVVHGVYGDPRKRNVVAMVALALQAEVEIDGLFDSFSKSAGAKVTDIREVPTGPLGGKAKCGGLRVERVPTAVCFWTDAGSAGLVWSYFRTVEQAAKEFAAIRSQIEYIG